MKQFDYLIERIYKAEFNLYPFSHIRIMEFFTDLHYQQIMKDNQITIKVRNNVGGLIKELLGKNYQSVSFPGCTSNIKQYIKAVNSNQFDTDKGLLESFGITFRLADYTSQFLQDLINFLNSSSFKNCLIEKFDIEKTVNVETAIQKNLHGYEISPHPDIRKKALTYMINISEPQAERINIHTHLLRFKSQYQYIYSFWENNPDIDRCWVPWNWCETKTVCSKNNSIVMFSPHSYSLHAVKCNYDHLQFQRNQIYGNLWYEENKSPFRQTYKDLDLVGRTTNV